MFDIQIINFKSNFSTHSSQSFYLLQQSLPSNKYAVVKLLIFPHGENSKEFRYMVEAGMPMMEALQSATITNAMILRQELNLGQIAPDYKADIIAVNEDPMQHISAMEHVVFVMKDGKVYKER